MQRQRRLAILSDVERDAMRTAGQFNAELMDAVRGMVAPGVTTAAIDKFVYDYTIEHNHVPACLNYEGFPNSCCTSVNEVICHGIPDSYELQEGDIVNVDLSTIVDGWHGDQSETFLIGEVTPEAQAVTQCAFDCLYLGIAAIRPNGLISDIGKAITEEATKRGFSVVKEFVGHGLGRDFHQRPNIPHYYSERHRSGERIPPGVCFTIEPMINLGTRYTELDQRDKWTVRTRDRKLSAQFEHSILMTDDGPEILTLTQSGPQEGDAIGITRG